MTTVNKKASKRANEKSREEFNLYLCLKQRVCPSCAGDLKVQAIGNSTNYDYKCKKCDFHGVSEA